MREKYEMDNRIIFDFNWILSTQETNRTNNFVGYPKKRGLLQFEQSQILLLPQLFEIVIAFSRNRHRSYEFAETVVVTPTVGGLVESVHHVVDAVLSSRHLVCELDKIPAFFVRIHGVPISFTTIPCVNGRLLRLFGDICRHDDMRHHLAFLDLAITIFIKTIDFR